MSEAVDSLRGEIRELFARRARGDIPERKFQKQLTEKSVELSRCVASDGFEPDESILAECHVVHSHLKLAQSILQEPNQITVSLFASKRRLVRVRGVVVPNRPVTCDEADDTVVDQLLLQDIDRVVPRKLYRWGEAATGLAAILLAWLLGGLLQVTGPFLMLLGFAGIVHALLLPTRWLDIIPRGQGPAPPFELHSIRKRSVRAVLAVIREAGA
jgi:hypothetical protein